MITLDRTGYGLKTVVAGTVTVAEARVWVEDLRRHLAALNPGFFVFSDQRLAGVISDPAVARELNEAIPALLIAGVARICVITASNATAMDTHRRACEAGLGEIYRCLSGRDPHAEQIAEAWFADGRRLVGV